eukprot:tig00021127_g18697.t1
MRNTIVSRCVTHCIDLRNVCVTQRRSGSPPRLAAASQRLAKPLERFQIDVSGAVGLDVGGSTGGFTDVLLASGARRLVNVVVCDASFIGLATVLPAAMALGADGCHLVALIKPGKGHGPCPRASPPGRGPRPRAGAIPPAGCAGGSAGGG